MFIRTERSIKEYMYAYPIVSTIIILNVILWVITQLLPFEFGKQLYFYGAGNNFMIHEFGEYWRLVTPIFLHASGFAHLLLNCIALIVFAPPLEQMLGKIKFILFYLSAGILGNVGTYLMNPESFTFHIGASGAIYGLFGIYVFMTFFRKHLIDAMSAQLVLMITVIGMISTFIIPGINIYAHLFGFIGGFVLGIIFLVNAQPFSIYKNKRPPSYSGPGGVAFDPNRWEKRRLIPEFVRKNSVVIIFIVIIIIVFLSRL